MICVYKITSPSGKVYVGSTIDFAKRISHYKRLDCKDQRKLYMSFFKYGFQSHIIEILEECCLELLLERERYYGEVYNCISDNGLNLALPGYGEAKAMISKETISKMKVSQSKESNNFYGRKHTVETVEKMKAAHANKTPETLLKMRTAQLGKKASDSSKEKMRLSQTGRRHSSKTRIKMRVNNNNVKMVLCTQTGIFYTGTKEAADSLGYNRHTLKNKLNGNKRNNTRFIYV